MYVHWEPQHVDHIAEHNIKQEEAEYVALHAQSPYPELVGEGKRAVWGQTKAGRFLQVIFVYRSVETIDLEDVPPHWRLELGAMDEAICIIHARELNAAEKRRLRRRRGRP
jgi:uncharacterized DUF497 family protein